MVIKSSRCVSPKEKEAQKIYKCICIGLYVYKYFWKHTQGMCDADCLQEKQMEMGQNQKLSMIYPFKTI